MKCARIAYKKDEDGNELDKGCTNEIFDKKTHNQKYCSTECQKIQTNANIMDKYYDEKRRLAGQERICKECKTTRLSRYNTERVCSACSKKLFEDLDKRASFLARRHGLR